MSCQWKETNSYFVDSHQWVRKDISMNEKSENDADSE